jgi:hypothetical protein
MSRYTKKSRDGRYQIAYGWDQAPLCGFFFQVYDSQAISEQNEEGIVVSEGLCPGIPGKKLADLLIEAPTKWGIPRSPNYDRHFALATLNIPF